MQESIVRCVQSVDEIKTTLSGMQEALLRGKKYIAASWIDDFSKMFQEFSIAEKGFMEKLRETLVQVRLKKIQTAFLANFLENPLGDKFSPQNIDALVRRNKE